MSNENTNHCLYCQKEQAEVPLIKMTYQDRTIWICPQHLPILIHKPEQLADVLPGAENWSSGVDHH